MKRCDICNTEFESNYKKVLTCSVPCRIERKNKLKREYSKNYYHANKNRSYVNPFLLAKL